MKKNFVISEVRHVSAYRSAAVTAKPRDRVTLRSPKSPRRSTPPSREGSRNGNIPTISLHLLLLFIIMLFGIEINCLTSVPLIFRHTLYVLSTPTPNYSVILLLLLLFLLLLRRLPFWFCSTYSTSSAAVSPVSFGHFMSALSVVSTEDIRFN